MIRRQKFFFMVLTLVLLASIVLGTAIGNVNLPLSRTAAILSNALIGGKEGGWPPWQQTVLLWVRLPRVLVAALAGGGLALSGAVMQAIFRNPMADPGILGVSAGASLGAVLVLYAGLSTISLVLVPAGAFLGALACAFLVYGIATSKGKSSVSTLLLAGVAISSIAIAATSFVLTLSLRRWEIGRQILSWIMGNLEGRSWGHVALAAPLVIGGCLWLSAYARELNVLLTGEDNAMAVGIDLPRVRRNLLLLVSLVTAATVSVAGTIGFVGLIIPHAMRLMLGPDNRRLLPAAFLSGSSFLILADTFCRLGVVQDLRLGVVTSLFGGPLFLYLLLRNRQRTHTL